MSSRYSSYRSYNSYPRRGNYGGYSGGFKPRGAYSGYKNSSGGYGRYSGKKFFTRRRVTQRNSFLYDQVKKAKAGYRSNSVNFNQTMAAIALTFDGSGHCLRVCAGMGMGHSKCIIDFNTKRLFSFKESKKAYYKGCASILGFLPDSYILDTLKNTFRDKHLKDMCVSYAKFINNNATVGNKTMDSILVDVFDDNFIPTDTNIEISPSYYIYESMRTLKMNTNQSNLLTIINSFLSGFSENSKVIFESQSGYPVSGDGYLSFMTNIVLKSSDDFSQTLVHVVNFVNKIYDNIIRYSDPNELNIREAVLILYLFMCDPYILGFCTPFTFFETFAKYSDITGEIWGDPIKQLNLQVRKEERKVKIEEKKIRKLDNIWGISSTHIIMDDSEKKFSNVLVEGQMIKDQNRQTMIARFKSRLNK